MGKKIGLCLTGGGARGGYQIGAVKALEELGILEQVTTFSGTSIGAANACVIASRGLAVAEHVWRHMPQENIPKIKKDDQKKTRLETGYYSMEVFEQVMKDAIDYDALRQKEVYITVALGGSEGGNFVDFFKTYFNHYLRKDSQVKYMPVHALSNQLVHQSVIASCSIPFFFPPVKMDGNNCFDGGMYDRIPVKPLVEAGCEEIIIIHLHKNRHHFFNPKKIGPSVTFHEIKHKGKELGRVLKFSHAQTEKLIDIGYQETKAYFEHLSK